jgi:hypothetical protein
LKSRLVSESAAAPEVGSLGGFNRLQFFRRKVGHGIARLFSVSHFQVQVRAGRSARTPHQSNRFSATNRPAFPDQDFACVSIPSAQAFSMVNDYHASVTAIHFSSSGEYYRAVCACKNRSPPFGRDIHAGMQPSATRPERRRYGSGRQGELQIRNIRKLVHLRESSDPASDAGHRAQRFPQRPNGTYQGILVQSDRHASGSNGVGRLWRRRGGEPRWRRNALQMVLCGESTIGCTARQGRQKKIDQAFEYDIHAPNTLWK